jgi:hypothetical protein
MRLNRKALISVSASLVILASIYFTVRSKQKTPPVDPPRTAEDILTERSQVAARFLDHRLAKLLTSKNWSAFDKEFSPEKDSRVLGDILRAYFIHLKLDDFTRTEKDRLLHYSLLALDKHSDSQPLDFLLISQVERLPEAITGGEAEKILIRWLSKGGHSISSQKKWLAVRKLGAQRLQPRPDAIELLRAGLYKKDRDESDQAWGAADQVRNVETRNRILSDALTHFSKIPDFQQGRALGIIAGGIRKEASSTSRIKALSLRLLGSGSAEKVEGALRGVVWLESSQTLSPGEKGEIVRILTSIPESVRTPFIQAKSEEIIRLLQP